LKEIWKKFGNKEEVQIHSNMDTIVDIEEARIQCDQMVALMDTLILARRESSQPDIMADNMSHVNLATPTSSTPISLTSPFSSASACASTINTTASATATNANPNSSLLPTPALEIASNPEFPVNPHSHVLVLDLRSFLVYNQSHIKNAINVCIPKTLAKRQGFNVKSIDAGISKKSDKDLFKTRKGSTVILYDQNGQDRDPNSLLGKCYESLVKEGLCYQVFWLEGGFAKLQNEYPNYVRVAKNIGNVLKPSLSKGRINTAPADLTAGPDDKMIEVTDYLYLSGVNISEDLEILRKFQIRYIINAAVELPNTFEHTGLFVYKRLELHDHPSQHISVVDVFESAFKFIDEARRQNLRTLVHCRGGRSRSATIVIAYLMKTNNWTLQQAYEHVQSRHPKLSPNLGFMGQLINFENLLRKSFEIPASSTSFKLQFIEEFPSKHSSDFVQVEENMSGTNTSTAMHDPLVSPPLETF